MKYKKRCKDVVTESGYRKRSNCTLHVNFTSGQRKMENEISISKCYIIYRFLYWTVSVMASTSRKDQQTSGSLRTHPRTKWWCVFVDFADGVFYLFLVMSEEFRLFLLMNEIFDFRRIPQDPGKASASGENHRLRENRSHVCPGK